MSGGTFLRGAFVTYVPGQYPRSPRAIPFRFNPETLSRAVAVEAAQSPQGMGGGATEKKGPAPAGDASVDVGGAVKESFSVLLRFDLAERDTLLTSLDPSLGVAPEIAAVEQLMYPAADLEAMPTPNAAMVTPAPQRPTVLFVWGRKRVLPVRITGLKIDEALYNDQLNPIRVEIDVTLEVMGDADARNDLAVRAALTYTSASRRGLAESFYANTAAQGSNILPL